MELDKYVKLQAFKARSQKLRARGNLVVKLGMIAMLALPGAFGTFAWILGADAWRAVSGAQTIKGTVHEVERESYTYEDSDGDTRSGTRYTVYVEFASDSGERLVKPLQRGGASDDDTAFADDLVDMDDYREGAVIDILYHPELEHRIWPDDFRALWLAPLILGLVTLLGGFLVIGGMIALWPRQRDFQEMQGEMLRQRPRD